MTRMAVVVGQCAYTTQFLRAFLKANGAARAVVIGASVDHDPFSNLPVDEAPPWLKHHRYYLEGWRQEARTLCRRYGVPLIETTEVLHALPPSDALVVAGLGCKIPDAILKCYGEWGLNVHSSPLPRYAGPQPEAQAILHDEQELGVTVHTMTAALDAGPIRYLDTFPIEAIDDVHNLECKAAALGGPAVARLLRETRLPLIERTGAGSYFGWYRPDEVLDLRSATVAEASLQLRLRPEGWAFLDERPTRIYPIEVSSEGPLSGTSRTLRLKDGALAVTHWVERRGDQRWVSGDTRQSP